MARFRLTTDILSPVHSDISLNDISAFSFGSLTGTPDSDKDIESPINKYMEKDSDVNSKGTMKETADVFDVIVNDIKKQSDLNAKREEKFRESYEMLKHSMDELLQKKSLNSSILSPVSKGVEFEQSGSKIKVDKIDKISKELKINKNSSTSRSENYSETLCKKIENAKKGSCYPMKQEQKKSHQNESIHLDKLSADNVDAKLLSKAKNSETDSSIKMSKEIAESRISLTKSEAKESRTIKDFKFKSEQKIPVSDMMPVIENKSLSIEKSIQIAVGMEMDKIRSFILDQNISLRKEIFKLQDMVEKQNKDTGYLFSVIDGLLETNKKLISK